jgi:transcriptional regulator with XRE-family HTH domain
MTHFQELFIKNLRFFRGKKGISQLAFSEMIEISPNYLNAVENGKNFPSPEVIQTILDTLELMPYQLFLEQPVEVKTENAEKKTGVVQELMGIKQKIVKEIDNIIKKYYVE